MKKVSLTLLFATGLVLMACPGPFHPYGPHYNVLIYYKNAKGEDLLNPATMGHYTLSDIRLNGLSSVDDAFRVDSIHNSFPKGFALSFTVWDFNSTCNNCVDMIKLNSSTTDTLLSKIESSALKSCIYNRVNVLPANLPSRNGAMFAIEIAK